MRRTSHHLTEEELLWLVVAPQDCSTECTEHVKTCSACSEEVRRLKEALTGLGTAARTCTPKPRRIFSVPEEKRFLRWMNVFFQKPVRTAAAAALAAGFLVLGTFLLTGNRPPDLASLRQEMTSDTVLLASVDKLISDPMADEFEGEENGLEEDDDFLRFVAPFPEEDRIEFTNQGDRV